MLKKAVPFSARISMYQEHFPWDVIPFQEHFSNNVCNLDGKLGLLPYVQHFSHQTGQLGCTGHQNPFSRLCNEGGG